MENNQQKLDTLKAKYQSALGVIEQQQVRLQNLHVQDGKLFLRGVAPSEDAKNRVWDQIKRVDPTYSDLTADITVDQTQAQSQTGRTQAVGAGIGGGQHGRTYKVQSGDTLSKISRQFYGDPNQYMRIFEANRNQLSDPNKIQAGQELVIP
jgi:LysM repeat protein